MPETALSRRARRPIDLAWAAAGVVDRARSNLVRPWLPTSHRNFFVIYTATILFNLWTGLNGVFGPDKHFQGPLFEPVNNVADHHIWGAAYLTVALGLYGGLHLRTFRGCRIFLAIGFALSLFRLSLFTTVYLWGNASVGNTLSNLFLCVAVHLAQTLEPPINPASQR